MLYLCAMANSLCLDWLVRLKVDDTLNMFYVYSLPVPRLSCADGQFKAVVAVPRGWSAPRRSSTAWPERLASRITAKA